MHFHHQCPASFRIYPSYLPGIKRKGFIFKYIIFDNDYLDINAFLERQGVFLVFSLHFCLEPVQESPDSISFEIKTSFRLNKIIFCDNLQINQADNKTVDSRPEKLFNIAD